MVDQLGAKLMTSWLWMLYFAFVHTQLLYGIEIYGSAARSHLNKLIILNNKILRIIQNKPIQYCVLDLYKSYKTLAIPELYKLQLLCLVHKYLYCNCNLPDVFANYFSLNNDFHQYLTRSSSHLHLPRVNTSYGSRCIKFKASQLWNTIPEELKSIYKWNSFKNYLKSHLFNDIKYF